jgi:hypothetical protein
MRVLTLLALASTLAAQARDAATFAPPVRIEVNGKWLGATRLYPSPVLHDRNGDGRADLVIGDLRGHLTVALRQPGAGIIWAAETKVMASDGKLLDFANW